MFALNQQVTVLERIFMQIFSNLRIRSVNLKVKKVNILKETITLQENFEDLNKKQVSENIKDF